MIKVLWFVGRQKGNGTIISSARQNRFFQIDKAHLLGGWEKITPPTFSQMLQHQRLPQISFVILKRPVHVRAAHRAGTDFSKMTKQNRAKS